MGYMTNEDFKKLTKELEDGTSKTDAGTVLLNHFQTSDFDGYDEESLTKLEDLLKNNMASVKSEWIDAIRGKIATQRQKIAEQAALDQQKKEEKPVQTENPDTEREAAPKEAAPKEEPTAKTPEEEKPAKTEEAPVKTETPTKEETPDKGKILAELNADVLDGMTSRNILNLYNNVSASYEQLKQEGEKFANDPSLRESPEAAQLAQQLAQVRQAMKTISQYAQQEVSETVLSEHNAPTVRDYVEILTKEDENYKYENQAGLESALADYDKTNGLDGELPTEEQIRKNEQKWMVVAPTDYVPEEFAEDKSIGVLGTHDPETYREFLETIRTASITELATEEPEKDAEKAQQRYKEKFNEVTTQYIGAISATLDGIMRDEEQQKKWWAAYCKANNIPMEKIDELKADTSHPEEYQKHVDAYKAFVVSYVYKTINGVYTEKNAVYASRLAQKTNMNTSLPMASQQKLTMWQKHPEIMKAVKTGGKNGALSVAMFATLGPIGLTAKQGWQLVGAFKKSYNDYAEQNPGKKSIKGYFNYLKNNKEQMINLAKQTALFAVSGAAVAALAASGALSFGLVGNLAGFGATNVAAAAAQAGAIKLMKLKTAGVITAAAGAATYLLNQHKLSPKKKELMAILQQHLPAEQSTEKKGFFARFSKSDPAKDAYKDLTKLLKNNDEKLSAKIEALNLPPEQKERVMQLAKEIKTLRAGKGAAMVGAFVGGGMMGGEYAQNLVGNIFGLNNGGNGGAGNWDMNKSFAQNMEDNKFVSDFEKNNTVEQIPLRPGEHLPEQSVDATEKPAFRVPYAPGMEPDEMGSVTLPADSFERGGDMWFATQMGPTVLEEKLRAMGFDAEMDKLPRGSHGAIPSRVMANYLQNANLSPEQAKELQDLAHDRESFLAECKRVNLRDGYDPYAQSGASHTGNVGNGGNAATNVTGNGVAGNGVAGNGVAGNGTVGNVTDQSDRNGATTVKVVHTEAKSEKGGWLNRLLHKKTQFATKFIDNGNPIDNARAVATDIAMQRNGTNMADFNAVQAAQSDLRQNGFHETGSYTDDQNVTHKYNYKIKNGVEKLTVDGVRAKIHHTDDAELTRFTRGTKQDANYVGDANGTKADRIEGEVKRNGVTTTYVRDGDTKDIYAQTTINGQRVVTKTDLTLKQVKNILKGKTNS